MPPSRPLQLLGLSGSIRRESNCTAVLRTIQETLPAPVALSIFDLTPVPNYNEDYDNELAPEPVKALKRAVVECDGLVVISPEYNHGMSGLLKNAIDWVSRPGYESILKHKPVVVMTASISPRGGVRAQVQLHELFLSTVSRIPPSRQIAITNIGKKVSDGRLTDPDAVAVVMKAVALLVDEIVMVQGRPG
jgi:chromate reductase